MKSRKGADAAVPLNASLETETVDKCVLCAKTDPRSDARFSRLLALVHPYDVKRCTGCGLRWLSPRPSASGYAELYKYEHYFEGQEGQESYDSLVAARINQFRSRLKEIRSFFPAGQDVRLLDIGAATGEFVHEAMRQGFLAEGLEVSKGAREKAYAAYGLELKSENLEELNASKCYDFIHMSHVLEHLPNPAVALEACFRLLTYEGMIVVEVPHQFDNDVERLKRVLGLKRPRFDVFSLHHTYFFSPDTLERLMAKSGFDICRIATANSSRTPLRPFSIRHLFLRYYLWLADKIHQGGNIIEVVARKVANDR